MTDFSDKQRDATVLAEVLSALANSSRLMILLELKSGEVSVNELAERLGLSQSALSQHLTVLRRAHLVQNRRSSQRRFYSVANEQLDVVGLVLQSFFQKTGELVVRRLNQKGGLNGGDFISEVRDHFDARKASHAFPDTST